MARKTWKEKKWDRINSAFIYHSLVNSIPGLAASKKPTRVVMEVLDFFLCPKVWDKSMSAVCLGLSKAKLSSNSKD